MAELQLASGEVLVEKMVGNLITRDWAFPLIGFSFKSGMVFLTSERIVYHQRPTALIYLGGLLAYFSKGRFEFDIPLVSIERLTMKSNWLLGRSLLISRRSGNPRQVIVKLDQFIEALGSTLSAHHGRRLVPHGKSEWVVQEIP